MRKFFCGRGVDNVSSQYYRSQLFNELYFLVDGGTIWTDSCNAIENPLNKSENILPTILSPDKIDRDLINEVSIKSKTLLQGFNIFILFYIIF
jgi:hypothetical protein